MANMSKWDAKHWLAIGTMCWGRSLRSAEAAKRVARSHRPPFVKRSSYNVWLIPMGCDYAISDMDGTFSWDTKKPLPEQVK